MCSLDENNTLVLWERLIHSLNKGKSSETCDLIVKNKIFLNNYHGNKSLLHLAVRRGQENVVDCLLEHGVNVNATDRDLGRTPLHLACYKGHISICQLLLVYGADITQTDKLGYSALFFAIQKNRLALREFLLKEGLRLPTYKAYYRLCKFVVNGRTDDVQRFFENSDQDVDFKALRGESPLHFAVLTGHLDIAEFLLHRGARPNSSPCNRILLSAIERKDFYMVQLLLKFGADVEKRFCSGFTPLGLAVHVGMPDCVDLLVAFGAAVNEECMQNGSTALHVACITESFKYFPNASQHYCSELEQRKIMSAQILLLNGAKTEMRNDKGMTPLHIACARGCSRIVELLLNSGADSAALDNENLSTLHYAAANKETTGPLRVLLRRNLEITLDPNCMSDTGDTPLMYSATNRCESFRTLLEHGGDVNLPNRAGNFPCISRSCSVLDCPSINHLKKMELLGYRLNYQTNESFIRIVNQRNILREEAWMAEIDQLNDVWVRGYPRITLYNLLFMGRRRLVRFADNKHLAKMYEKSGQDFTKYFPHFGFALNERYRRSKNRRTWVILAEEKLYEVTQLSIPDDCTDLIFKYLNNKELKQFANTTINDVINYGDIL